MLESPIRPLVGMGACALAVLVVSPVQAERLDTSIPVKGTAAVTVHSAGDVASAGFLLSENEGTKVSVLVKPAKKSPLQPAVKLIAPDGTEFDATAAGGKVKAKTKSFSAKWKGVTQSGLWRVEVRSANGEAGAAVIKLNAVEKLKLSDKSRVVPFGSYDEVKFRAGEDQELTVTLKRGKNSRVIPAIELLDPNGEDLIDTGDVAVNTKKGSAALKKFRLPLFGEYRLRVSDKDGGGGAFTLKLRSKRAKLKGTLPEVIADAGASAEPGNEARLAAEAPAGSTFRWTQVHGEAVELSDPMAQFPTFTAPESGGALGFQVSVESPGGILSHALPVGVEVGPRPVADAGRSQSVAAGADVQLDGSGSLSRSANGLGFRWVQDPADATQVTLDDPSSATPSFTAPGAPTTLHFALEVDDGFAVGFEDVVTVAVGDLAAVADAGREQFVGRMATVHLSGLGSIRPGAALDGQMAWQQIGGNPTVTLGGLDATPCFTAPRQNADLVFALTLDGNASTRDTVMVHVRGTETNVAPRAVADAVGAVAQTGVDLGATADDPDNGDTASFRWAQLEGPVVTIADPAAQDTDATLPALADHHVVAVQVNDGLAYSGPDFVQIYASGATAGPIADAGSNANSRPGQKVTLNGSGSVRLDGGVDPLTFSWTQLSGLDWFDVEDLDPTFNGAAVSPSFTLPAAISSLTPTRTVTFALIVNDGANDSLADLVTVRFTNIALNGVPFVTAQATPTNPIAGGRVDLLGTATDLDGDPVTTRWTQVSGGTVMLQPNGNAVDPFFIAPASGTLVLRFTASDPFDTSQPADVTVTVDRKPTAVVSITPTMGSVGQLVTVDGTGSSDPEGEDVTYAWSQLAGPTVSFNPAAASFSFNAQDGLYRFQLVVNDRRQDSVAATGTFSTAQPPTVAPTSSLQKAPYGGTVSLMANPSETAGVTYEWRVVSKSAVLPTISLSSTTAQNPTFSAPLPSSQAFGGSDYNGANESLPSATFGVVATNAQGASSEQTVVVKFYASLDNPTNVTGTIAVYSGIISGTCTGCHSGTNTSSNCGFGNNAAFFGMGSKAAFLSNAVGIATSCSSSASNRITAGNLNNSALHLRINGSGGAMPPSGLLQARDRNVISDWISQGAKDN